ncbi:MAG: prenyltransferase [Sorangiineae bacterium]|nr:prenyltransferase [Polyangiaceae bacterium]MEB2321548.1 prenyltransferase [Sorangiineae bacterium]
MNVVMWGRALSVIPRISKEEWNELDVVSRWLIATRSAVIVMTVISSAIAGLLAARDRLFDLKIWSLVTLGLVFAHATNNIVNDLTDHKKGVDKDNYFRAQYGPQPLEHGLMTPAGLIRYAIFSGVVALAAGVALVFLRGQATLILFGIGILLVLFYTWPLKYIGLGEPTVLLVWGPLMVGGGYYEITGRFDWLVVAASLPFALGSTAVLFGKHVDKIDADRAKGIRTMPVLLGERASRWVTVGMIVAQYGIAVALVAVRYFSPILLLVLVALPTLRLVLKAYSRPRPKQPPRELPPNVWPLWFVAFAFLHMRRFGMLYVLGIVADVALHRAGLI